MVLSYVDFAISAMLAASAIVPVVYNVTSRRRREAETRKGGIRINAESVSKLLSRGYAYTVDIGDSFVVVVVFSKSGASRGFSDAEPVPLEATHIGGEFALEASG